MDQGQPAAQDVSVTYAGRGDWRIDDVRSDSDHLEAELIQQRRTRSRVNYVLKVRLKNTAPPGFFREQLILVTNDAHNPRIPLVVEGRVRAAVSIAPESLALGHVALGSTVSKRIIVRAKAPFRILDVTCDDDGFSFSAPETAAQRHIVTVTFSPKTETGRIQRLIHVQTDLGEKVSATCTAYATVTPVSPVTETAAEPAGSLSAATDL
jgi:hypothetical protein